MACAGRDEIFGSHDLRDFAYHALSLSLSVSTQERDFWEYNFCRVDVIPFSRSTRRRLVGSIPYVHFSQLNG